MFYQQLVYFSIYSFSLSFIILLLISLFNKRPYAQTTFVYGGIIDWLLTCFLTVDSNDCFGADES